MNSTINQDKLGLIIAAGGTGSRFSKEKHKLFIELNGKPLFINTIMNFTDIILEKNMILVINKDLEKDFKTHLSLQLPNYFIKLVTGGTDRMHSVYNGIKALPENIEYVAIHDAARPYASAKLLLDCFKMAKTFGSAVPAKKVTDTLKVADSDNLVKSTLDRSSIWKIETPQVFKKNELTNAYEKAFKENFSGTDDASVMENAGFRPYLMENLEKNIKITYPMDLIT